MNSRKTNLRLIENIATQVPNTAFAFAKANAFLERMIFQLMFKIIK